MKINKFAVIGNPIKHTMSPFIHRELFKLSGFAPKYDVLQVEDVVVESEKLKTYDGLNITIPHKTNIMKLLSHVDEKALKFSSVNAVKNENGELFGYTTDGTGAIKALEDMNANFKGNVLILGSGGAARALAFELDEHNSNITIAARDVNKALEITNELTSATACTIEKAHENSEYYDLIINATSVGMYPKNNACVADERLIKRCDAVFDIVYNPQDTMLIQLANSLDKKIIYGMDMLVFQAVVAHEIWYGAKFKREDILKLITLAKEECIRLFGNK